MQRDANPFGTSKNRTRVVVAVLGAVLALAIAAGVISVVFDGERLVRRRHGEIDAVRARYCAVFEAAKREKTSPQTAPPPSISEPVVIVESISLFHEVPEVTPGSNADKVEFNELEDLCVHGKVGHPLVMHSQVTPIFRPEEKLTRSYGSVKHLLEAMKRIRYLVVFDLESYKVGMTTGDKTMAAGGTKGAVHLYRLDGASWHGTVDVTGAGAPGAIVWGRRTIGGGINRDDADRSLSVSSMLALEKLTSEEFAALGVDLRF